MNHTPAELQSETASRKTSSALVHALHNTRSCEELGSAVNHTAVERQSREASPQTTFGAGTHAANHAVFARHPLHATPPGVCNCSHEPLYPQASLPDTCQHTLPSNPAMLWCHTVQSQRPVYSQTAPTPHQPGFTPPLCLALLSLTKVQAAPP